MKIVEELRDMGYSLTIHGETIRYQCAHDSPSPGASALLIEIKRRKSEVLSYLNLPWPPECRESESKFGHGPARLYPLLDKTIATPHGNGKLWQVGSHQIGVILFKNPEKVTFMPWHEARPSEVP